MRLYLDDLRDPRHPENFDYIARSSSEAIEIMEKFECPTFCSLDHDLGGDDTAMVVVKFMVNKDLDNPGWIPLDFSWSVHSANPVGAANIEGYLNAYMRSRK